MSSTLKALAGSSRGSRRIAAALAGVLVLAAAIYWPGLSGDLVLDDAVTLEPVARLAQGELGWREALLRHDNFRPLSMASFVANWLTTGDRVWPLKLTNLVLHLVCGVLVFLLAEALLARPVAGVDRGRRWLVLWITACWLLAPLSVSTVLYVTQRMAILAALFSLAALLAYVHGRARIAERRAGGATLLALALGVFWPLAILSKENGVLVPILAVVVELFLFAPARAEAGEGPRRGLRRAIIVGFVGAALVGACALLAIAPREIFLSYEYRPFTLGERLMTEWRILFDYVANLLLLPGASPFGIYHDRYPLSHGLLDPASTLLAGLAWLAVLAAGWRTRGTRLGLVLFGAWFFLGAHLAESTILPLELYFEHRNYLPSFGIYFSLGYAGYLLLSRVRLARLTAAALVLVPLGLGVVTYHRVLVWQSWQRMLLAAESHDPNSLRVQTGLANLYADRGELDQALAHLARAAERADAPALGIALQALGIHCLTGQPPPATAYARLAGARASDDFYSVNALGWLADAIERGACPQLDTARIARALDALLAGVEDAGSHGKTWLLHVHAARLLAAAGREREALPHLDVAAALEPERLEPLLLAMRYRLDLGASDEAERTLHALEARDRGRIASHSRLIDTYRQRLDALRAHH